MVVELKGITKEFPGVRALDSVNFSLSSGEVIGLVGENGAGKSTLMKILSGVYAFGDYKGELLKDKNPLHFSGPLDAEESGIAIIHQELSGFPHLTVAENFFVGRWPVSGGKVLWEKMADECVEWLSKVGAQCKPTDLMANLGLGQQQLVEIAKALRKNSQVFIFDEPTSSLTPLETEKLYALIESLKAQGKAIVYISHRMDEIFYLCDKIVVLRDGKSVAEAPKSKTNANQVVEWMVGRAIQNIYPDSPVRKKGETLLTMKNFSATLSSGKKIGPVTLSLSRGEILGLGGLLGAGRSEIAKIIFGDESVVEESGDIQILGKPRSKTPHDAIQNGVAFVSEDRKGESILPDRNLTENATLSWISCCFGKSVLHEPSLQDSTESKLKHLKTRFARQAQLITDLSGGNQQKVILSRALMTDCPIIILDEPTRGIDVNAKKEIYEIIYSLAKDGYGILFISSDLSELMAMSDRILMIKDSRVAGESLKGTHSQESLMKMAFGLKA